MLDFAENVLPNVVLPGIVLTSDPIEWGCRVCDRRFGPSVPFGHSCCGTITIAMFVKDILAVTRDIARGG